MDWKYLKTKNNNKTAEAATKENKKKGEGGGFQLGWLALDAEHLQSTLRYQWLQSPDDVWLAAIETKSAWSQFSDVAPQRRWRLAWFRHFLSDPSCRAPDYDGFSLQREVKCSWCSLTQWINETTCNFTQQPHKQWRTHFIHFNMIKSPSLVRSSTFDASVSDMRSYVNYFCHLHVFFFFKAHPWRQQTASFTQMQLFPLHCFLCLCVKCIFFTAHISWCFQFSGSILSVGSSFWYFIFFFWYILPSFGTHTCDWYVTQRRQTARLRKLLQQHNGGLVACSVALPVTWMTVPPRFLLLLLLLF